MKISYQWLQHHFKEDLPSIDTSDEVLALYAFETEGIENVDDDQVIDVDVLPNRAHDCLSHIGIATEFAGLSGLKLKSFDDRYFYETEPQKSGLVPSVTIENTDQCRRYMGRVIENVQVTDSPKWLKDRIESIGQRSINNIVDATNYVMFDLGNPIHAFDMDKITDNSITVRNAGDGESIKTLGKDGDTVELDSSMLVIADNDGPLALAGIKGGTKAEVDKNTKNIVLEVANFEPLSTRKTRQKVGIMTDSSKRFENELSPELAGITMDAITKLIIDVASTDDTQVGDIIDEYPNPVSLWAVAVSTEHTNRLLGTNLSDNDIVDIFDRYDWQFEQDGDVFTVTPPPLRIDLQIQEDIIEEIGRVYGYANIDNANVAELPYTPNINPHIYHTQKIRNILKDAGYTEVMTYTFVKKGKVETANAFASDKGALRKNLSKGLTEARDRNVVNAELFGDDVVRMFEIGTVFKSDGEHMVLGITAGNKKGPVQKEIDTVQKLLAEKLGDNFDGEINDGVLEVQLEPIFEQSETPDSYVGMLETESAYADAMYVPFSKHPIIMRDVAVWTIGDDAQKDLVEILQSVDLLAREPRLVDEFTKDDRTSYAYRLVFQANDRTLTDTEVNEEMEKIYAKIAEKDNWEVR